MTYCPKCGNEIHEDYNFCKFCGAQLTKAVAPQKAASSLEEEVKNIITRRFDGIKNRDEKAVSSILDEARYSKFDDWPPHGLQTAGDALKNEFGAFKVLSNYNYEIKNFKVEAIGEAAVATFYIHYYGEMRRQSFDVYSRVTTILQKQDSEWKIIHEHYSRFPEEQHHGFLGR